MNNTNSKTGKVNISFISPSGVGGSIVKSVNNKTGNVFLTAEDVGALPNTTEIPSIEGLATEDYVDRAVENVDLTNYYTRNETNNKFALKTEIPETSHLASKTYVDTKVKNVEVDLTGYATEDYVDAAIADLDVPEGVATEEYVQKKIAEAQLGEGDVDLSAYYTKSETDAAIEAAAPDLSGYALKTEIPSTTGLATESYVDEKFNSIEIPEVDLTDYYTKSEVDKKITDAVTGGEVDLSNYYTKSEVDTAIENVEVDLTGYATEKYVGEQIAAIPAPDLSAYAKKEEIPSTAGLATEKYVDDAIDAIEIPDNTPIATTEVAGKVKPDGTTITIAEDGTISSVGGSGGGSAEVVVDGYTITKNADGALTLAYPINTDKASGKGLAIGNGSIATGTNSLAAGSYVQATGFGSIALGTNVYANGSKSVSIGHGVTARGEAQVVLGKKNISDSAGKYVLIVGNGKDSSAETNYQDINSNGMTIDWNGNVWATGFYAGGTSQDDASELATKQYVDDVAAGSIDMSTYATRTYVDDAITEALAAIVDGDEVSY